MSTGEAPRQNRGHIYREQLGPEAAGRTLLQHLVAAGRSDEASWRARIAGGQLSLDGAPAAADAPLRPGQQLAWARPPWVEPEVPLATAVLYQDDELLAVAKPSGLPCNPAGGEFLEHTLLRLVRRRAPEASPMHRLGRATSGLLLFARTAAARQSVQAVFRERRVRKLYRALCSGHPERDSFAIEAPIGEVPHALLGTLHAASPAGRPSRSLVRVLERRGTGAAPCALLEVEIETGRPHQIRIHLAWAGHPLVGDPLYCAGGLPAPGSRALPGDPGYLLHALSLELAHPRSGRPLYLCCPPPPPLRLPGPPGGPWR
jgi:23S rRNA pseudouridine1911/1915/1917 synthase